MILSTEMQLCSVNGSQCLQKAGPTPPPPLDAFRYLFWGPYSLHIIKDPYYFTWERKDERTHTPYDPFLRKNGSADIAYGIYRSRPSE